MPWRLSAEVLPDRSLDLSFRNRPDHPPALDAVPEENEKGNAVHAERRRRLWVLVAVEFGEADVVALGRQLLDHRGDHAARAAPRGPEIDDRGTAADLLAKVRVVERERMRAVAVCRK